MQHEAVREYLKGALWAYPTVAVLLALGAGSVLTQIEVPPGSWFGQFLFQGTADDARTLLIGISGTMMTVIALVLGLTLVALQLSSTQFSPRLLRNFLRDRTNQLVLAMFVLTFTYATAGLYTVGIEEGRRIDAYPRLAVTVAILLLFGSLMVLVFFVHHIAHAIQVDEVMRRVEHNTLLVIHHDLPTEGVCANPCPEPPPWAVAIASYASGYVQTVHHERLLALARTENVTASITPMVGEHVIEQAPLVWIWRSSPEQPPPDPAAFRTAVHDAVRIGFERTAEQDVALGVRQLADIAVKALSPAINDPYTSIQALEHISVLLAALAQRELGPQLIRDGDGTLRVVVPGRDLAYFLELATGQIRRYGRTEPRVMRALLRVLRNTGQFCRDDSGRALVAAHVRLVMEAAEAGIDQRADLEPVLAHGESVLESVTG